MAAFPVDRLQHSLQTATRAHRGGEAEDYVVMALLHDIGDTLGAYNHPDIAAAILKPFVDERLHWIAQQHGIFQGYYFFHYIGLDRDMREAFRGHPHFEDTARFCEALRPGGVRPGLRQRPARLLRADGAARFRGTETLDLRWRCRVRLKRNHR